MKRWLICVLLFAAGCAAHHPPTPQPFPAPATGIEVFNDRGPVVGAAVKLAQGGPEYTGVTNNDGYLELASVPRTDSPTWRVWVSAAGCTDYSELLTLGSIEQIIRIGQHDVHPGDIPLPAMTCTPPAPVITERIRTVNGHFNILWLGISEFDLIHLVRTGQVDEAKARIAQGVMVGKRTVFRVFARAVNLFDLNPDQRGYWEAADAAIKLVNDAGAYVELVLFPDAQGVDKVLRHRLLQQYAARYGLSLGVTFQITNEPWQNGWASAVDPDLLQMADELARYLGHRDFSIGDAPDGDTIDASTETAEESVTLGKHANIIIIHSSRMGGAQPDGDRYRRYIDHGESFYDIMGQVRKVNPQATCVNDEPMGVASQRWVPIPGRAPYEREFEAEAVLADELTTLSIGCGHTFHHIATQDTGVPGLDLLGAIASRWPTDWSYRNDSWGGSATRGFTGFGKCRTYTNGGEAFVMCNGTNKGGVTWANGFQPVETVFDGGHVTVWRSIVP